MILFLPVPDLHEKYINIYASKLCSYKEHIWQLNKYKHWILYTLVIQHNYENFVFFILYSKNCNTVLTIHIHQKLELMKFPEFNLPILRKFSGFIFTSLWTLFTNDKISWKSGNCPVLFTNFSMHLFMSDESVPE